MGRRAIEGRWSASGAATHVVKRTQRVVKRRYVVRWVLAIETCFQILTNCHCRACPSGRSVSLAHLRGCDAAGAGRLDSAAILVHGVLFRGDSAAATSG